MNLLQGVCKMVFTLGLVLILAGAAQIPQPAWASMEDAAVFYDELKQQGEWVDYGDYGPVWYPTKVQENWRPYVDGRWTPSEEGHVFETQEPWGPTTYHYGNWMPTKEYGWVWVPGRTWYPNTVNWRTSPESEAPETSYIGWAPIPPPNYTPAPGYYPQDYSGSGNYGGGLDSLLTSPFWIFIKAASFLLGFGSPYAPNYSYWNSNALISPVYVPYYYTRTIIVNNYYTPAYYPAGYMVGGVGYYNWGPPIPYVSRVTRIKQVTINNYMQQVNIYQRRNVVPPPAFLASHPYFRDTLPPAMINHQPLPLGSRFQGAHVARANLVQPNLVNASVIKNAPGIPGAIPKAQMEAGPWQRGVPGAALPASAMIKPNRLMEERLKKIPASQRLEPVSPTARKWTVPQTTMPQTPAAAVVQPGSIKKQYRGPEPTTATPWTPSATPPGVAPYRHGPQGTPQVVTPGQPVVPQESWGRKKRMPTASEGIVPATSGPSQTVAPREKFKPREYQPGPWGKHEQSPQAVVTPGQYPRQRQPVYCPPGTPSTSATPSGVQPQPQIQRHPQPQVYRQPQPPPQPQVQQQPQIRPAPHYQPQPQVQPRPQAPQKQQDKKYNQQNQ